MDTGEQVERPNAAQIERALNDMSVRRETIRDNAQLRWAKYRRRYGLHTVLVRDGRVQEEEG